MKSTLPIAAAIFLASTTFALPSPPLHSLSLRQDLDGSPDTGDKAPSTFTGSSEEQTSGSEGEQPEPEPEIFVEYEGTENGEGGGEGEGEVQGNFKVDTGSEGGCGLFVNCGSAQVKDKGDGLWGSWRWWKRGGEKRQVDVLALGQAEGVPVKKPQVKNKAFELWES
ncbi:hypothetical protein GRF29_69g411615 [Pseudopithomyces chartarum]|uniref:Uncharacterized protein n=1 Tax=Pseudopithomyces chartarum TaxID=1892770 RepID=A0AAN6LZH0_9PLEO|nr:hypothetical protein GRF29_69g411615 [Pseudopithomyces chartarum]